MGKILFESENLTILWSQIKEMRRDGHTDSTLHRSESQSSLRTSYPKMRTPLRT